MVRWKDDRSHVDRTSFRRFGASPFDHRTIERLEQSLGWQRPIVLFGQRYPANAARMEAYFLAPHQVSTAISNRPHGPGRPRGRGRRLEAANPSWSCKPRRQVVQRRRRALHPSLYSRSRRNRRPSAFSPSDLKPTVRPLESVKVPYGTISHMRGVEGGTSRPTA